MANPWEVQGGNPWTPAGQARRQAYADQLRGVGGGTVGVSNEVQNPVQQQSMQMQTPDANTMAQMMRKFNNPSPVTSTGDPVSTGSKGGLYSSMAAGGGFSTPPGVAVAALEGLRQFGHKSGITDWNMDLLDSIQNRSADLMRRPFKWIS